MSTLSGRSSGECRSGGVLQHGNLPVGAPSGSADRRLFLVSRDERVGEVLGTEARRLTRVLCDAADVAWKAELARRPGHHHLEVFDVGPRIDIGDGSPRDPCETQE